MSDKEDGRDARPLFEITDRLKPLLYEAALAFVAGGLGAFLSDQLMTSLEEIVGKMDKTFFIVKPGPYFIVPASVAIGTFWLIALKKKWVYMAIVVAFSVAAILWVLCYLFYSGIVVDNVYWRFSASFVALMLLASGSAVGAVALIVWGATRGVELRKRGRPSAGVDKP